MVRQYPYIGRVYVPTESTKDSDGNWSQSTPELKAEISCRHEPNKGSQYIVGADGKQIVFNCIVYMPLPVEDIKPGSFFEVWDGESLKVKAVVIQFSKGQLNARVWV